MRQSIAKQRDRFTWSNRIAADVILKNIKRHGGPESGLVRWAKLFVERDREQQQPRERRCA